jgi:mRNA interferase MazF
MELIQQYQIVWVNLDPTVGSEIKKKRPCVVISPNEMNKFLQTIIVAPITSTSKPYPTRIQIITKKIKGWVVIDQIRTIDRIRITEISETLKNSDSQKIKDIIKETFVD